MWCRRRWRSSLSVAKPRPGNVPGCARCVAIWYNLDRPHMLLDGGTPEVRFSLDGATVCCRPRRGRFRGKRALTRDLCPCYARRVARKPCRTECFMRKTARLAAWCLAACLVGSSLAAEAALRQTVSLDGTWQIAEGTMEKIPAEFSHQVPVPGLADMAAPAFAEVGTEKSDSRREAFWYHRTFTVDGSIPAVAVLIVHKAMFGCRVILNGIPLGEHRGSFTQALFERKAGTAPRRKRTRDPRCRVARRRLQGRPVWQSDPEEPLSSRHRRREETGNPRNL